MRTQAYRIVDTDPERGTAVVRVTGTGHREPTYQVRQSLSITQEVPVMITTPSVSGKPGPGRGDQRWRRRDRHREK